jgi:hypothetical protein
MDNYSTLPVVILQSPSYSVQYCLSLTFQQTRTAFKVSHNCNLINKGRLYGAKTRQRLSNGRLILGSTDQALKEGSKSVKCHHRHHATRPIPPLFCQAVNHVFGVLGNSHTSADTRLWLLWNRNGNQVVIVYYY